MESLEKAALSEILSGGGVPGWKAVEGRSTRKLSDPDAAFAELMLAGYEEAVLFQRVPVALGELEKTVGKEDRQKINRK